MNIMWLNVKKGIPKYISNRPVFDVGKFAYFIGF